MKSQLVVVLLALTMIASGQSGNKNFKPRAATVRPPPGNIVGNTIDKSVGQQVTEALGVATLCGGEDFANGGPIVHWGDPNGGSWEYGYMDGPQNREVFGRHTYSTLGTYSVRIRVHADCKGKYTGYYDVVAGEATVKVH